MPRHFLDLLSLSTDEARRLLDQSFELKRREERGRRKPLLPGRTLGLLFEKPSLRTRVSFEAAIARLGGNAIFLNASDVGLRVRESVIDFDAQIPNRALDLGVTREPEGQSDAGEALHYPPWRDRVAALRPTYRDLRYSADSQGRGRGPAASSRPPEMP